jgi:hypothetical protein
LQFVRGGQVSDQMQDFGREFGAILAAGASLALVNSLRPVLPSSVIKIPLACSPVHNLPDNFCPHPAKMLQGDQLAPDPLRVNCWFSVPSGLIVNSAPFVR